MTKPNGALLALAACALLGCGSNTDAEDAGTGAKYGAGGDGSGAVASGGVSAQPGSGGAAGAPAAGAGASSSGGKSASGGGNTSAGSGGSAAGGTGSGGTSSSGQGGAVTIEHPPLDCGPVGYAAEDAGPPSNRVNYVIVGDGYTATTVETTLKQHIEVMLKRRFEHESGQPYARYRKFVNICVLKAVSDNDGIGNGPTAFDGGNGGDRLAKVNEKKVSAFLDANLPDTLEPDWRAVVLNQDKWENTGAHLMLWSGGNADAAGAALHEGGHGFHQLADEYGGDGSDTKEWSEVNTTADATKTAGKWDLWLDVVQKGLNVPDLGATGKQSVFEGSRYKDDGQYRPSDNSMMNSLFCRPSACGNSKADLATSFNAVSREQIVFSIWRAVKPIDAAIPPAGAVVNPAKLQVAVIDPAVIDVDWSIDGAVVAAKAGGTFDVTAQSLSAGVHEISATAYDNASEDLVRYRKGECQASVQGDYCHATGWKNSTQTVKWSVTVP
ncbi:MAG TPA: M64 family metallopeptidase [Polyangiaceae bacterium]|nr:M64 family metallopeptidase [Polyangiaceae bacterium]